MRLRLLIPFALLLLLLPAVGSAAPSKLTKKWPSVAKQLARDRVIPGSALEKLIRANQDASVLASWESDGDAIGLPLWLRVLWRKAHPDAISTADDPSGGYPLVLKETHEWFVHHQNLRRGKPEPGTRPLKRLTAGDNVQISGDNAPDPRSESDIRVLPGNPDVIVAACNNIPGSGGQKQMFSVDGGAHWGLASLPFTGNDAFHSDPAVDFTSDGVAWSLTIGGVTIAETRVRAYHSGKDAQGHNDYSQWILDGSTPSRDQTNADKEMMWIDHSATSPARDTIYAIWSTSAIAWVSHRPPDGPNSPGAWSEPRPVSGSETTGATSGSDIKTNANGEVFAFWPDSIRFGPDLNVRKLAPGGEPVSSPVEIASTFGYYQVIVPAFTGTTGGRHKPLIYISGGAYRNATKNLVYAAWMDLNQAGCCPNTVGGVCSTNFAPGCKTRIWFSRSTDGGSTWEAKKPLNDETALNDQFNPRLYVDETTGELTVIYYDTIQDPNRLKTHVYAQRSTDDGLHWEDPVQVTTAPSDETTAGSNMDNQYGDYNGISGYFGIVFPSWTDRRTPNAKEAIWTARLTNESSPPSTPTSLTATATSTSQVSLTWTPSPFATGYEVQRKSDGGPYQTVAAPMTASYVDTGLTANKTYVYIVRALNDQTGASGWSAPDLATTFFFTDDPVTAGGIVKAIHLTQFRTAVKLVRAAAGLTAFSFTDPTPTLIKALHVSELRSALNTARSTLGLPALSYTDPVIALQVTPVRAVHIQELRAGVK